ncbi:hypothetical protein MKW92_031977 [Papaver armeniacum]|nr:hypothetical protein MKW92_031977 [Papaver armeniacum]
MESARRGPTTLSKAFRSSRGLKKVVEYNELGQPVGLAAAQLSSYMGVLARHMVPIIHEKWSKVPRSLKDKIWCFLEGKFVLQPQKKRNLIQNVGALWRSFKSRLTRKYIMPFKDQEDLLGNPPAMYKFIDKRHWEEFVKIRLSKNFQVRREILSTRRKKNLYPHRLSRKGYADLMEQLKKKKGELSSDGLDRSILWKKAREDKNGNIPHDATKEKVEKIDKLTEQVNEGSLVTSGSNDILTLALGTAEQSGNVRGMGKFVSQGSYFHTARPKMQEEREARLRVEAELCLTKQRLARVEEQLALVLQTKGGTAPSFHSANTESSSESERISRLEAQLAIFMGIQGAEASIFSHQNRSTASKPSSSAGSSPKVVKDSEDKDVDDEINQRKRNIGIGKGKSCIMCLETSGSSIAVAKGKVFRSKSCDMLHNVPIGKGNVRVLVEEAIKPSFRLPIPLKGEEEIFLVGDAKRYHVAWPKKLVIKGKKVKKLMKG